MSRWSLERNGRFYRSAPFLRYVLEEERGRRTEQIDAESEQERKITGTEGTERNGTYDLSRFEPERTRRKSRIGGTGNHRQDRDPASASLINT